MLELIVLGLSAFVSGYVVSYVVMTFGIKQDKE
jgi:hypothetical protein